MRWTGQAAFPGLHICDCGQWWESFILEWLWLDGRAPRDIAPHLYSLAWQKGNTVKEDLINQRWTRGLWRMWIAEEMAEFVNLWGLLQDVQLSDHPDSIRWKWTSNGLYSSKSAYTVQFQGSFCTFDSRSLWRAHTEGKHSYLDGYWFEVRSSQLTNFWPGIDLVTLCAPCVINTKRVQHTSAYTMSLLKRCRRLFRYGLMGLFRCLRDQLTLKIGGTTPYRECARRTKWGCQLCCSIPYGMSGESATEESSTELHHHRLGSLLSSRKSCNFKQACPWENSLVF
jgi:hypothetical protein